MKNIKKILIGLCLVVLLTLTACTTNTTLAPGTYILPDLTDKSTDEVESIIGASPLTNYKITIKSGLKYIRAEGDSADEKIYEYDKFYGYAGHQAGEVFEADKRIIVYVTAQNIPSTLEEYIDTYYNRYIEKDGFENLELLNSLTLDGKDLSKSFIDTGLGEVTVTGYVDGDTTRFKDSKTKDASKTFSLRYLGVDTPESTASFEPWGKAAAKYTQTCLEGAKKVVLQSEYAGQKDGNDRKLGYVWYLDNNDVWHLLNLELVMFAYSNSKVESKTTAEKDKIDEDVLKIGDLIVVCGNIVGNSGRRIYGECDPAFDYSTDPKVLTIQYLREHFGEYYSRKVQVTGIIAMVDGNAPVLVDPETGFGIYFYVPSWQLKGTAYLKKGYYVTMTGVCTYYGIGSDEEENEALLEKYGETGNGSPQLTDFKDGCVTVLKDENGNPKTGTVDPVLLEAGSLTSTDICKYCTFEGLVIDRVYEASTGSGLTVYCTDLNGDKINIRIDDSNYFSESKPNGLIKSQFAKNVVIESVTGYLSFYGDYQLILTNSDDIVFGE